MTFRPIDIEPFRPCALRDQPAPTMEWVDLDRCVVDTRYQRDITRGGRAAIQRIAEGWDWTKFQPILCAATTDGMLAIVDGQHRAHAARVAGLSRLPALIVPMTPAQQAEAFRAVNADTVRLNRANVFKARLMAGDQLAVEAARAVQDAGCRLMTYTPSAAQRRPGDIFAHALILGMVDAGEAEAVTVGLRAIRESKTGSDDRDACNHHHLRVYDQRVLTVWLKPLATSQRFLRIPDLADVFDSIDFEDEYERAARWARANGGAVRPMVAERVTATLRAALQSAAA